MPFKSEAQRSFMYSQHPEIAKRWQKHTKKDADLPERVDEEKSEKKAAYRLGFEVGYKQAAGRSINPFAALSALKSVFASNRAARATSKIPWKSAPPAKPATVSMTSAQKELARLKAQREARDLAAKEQGLSAQERMGGV